MPFTRSAFDARARRAGSVRFPRLCFLMFLALEWFALPTMAEETCRNKPQSSAPVTGLGLKFDPILNLEPPTTGNTPFYIFGRGISGQTDDLIEAEGEAEFRQLGMFIKGDRIRHDLVRDELHAEGQVKLFREGEFYQGPRLRLKLGTTQGSFENIEYQLTSTGGRGSARVAEFLQPMETKLTDAVYTTCARDRPAWELRMSEMLIDQIREVGSTRSATLYWGDRALLPFGDMSFPIGLQRKTGFLSPSYTTSSKLGLEVEVPFYWNMAPNHDLTLSPRLISRRGLQLGSEFRFLRENALGTVRYEVLPDTITRTQREFAAVNTTYRVTPDTTLGVQVMRASDDNYFSDLGRSLLASSQRLLPATFTLNTNVAGWGLAAQAQEYQLLQDRAAPLIRPYAWAPRLAMSRSHRDMSSAEGFPLDWRMNAEWTSFRHATMAEGDRMVATGSLAWRHFTQGLSITPRVSLHATRYSHRQDGDRTRTLQTYLYNAQDFDRTIYRNNVGPDTDSYTRVLPTFSTEVGSVFERPLTFRGMDIEQTLEPRLTYIVTPYKDQSRYPVFDTGSPSLSFAHLFSDVAFNGHDRIADLNQVTAGMTTRFIEEKSGAELLRAAVGQRFYFADQRVTLPGGTPRTDRNSDLLGQISARPLRGWAIDSQVQYTPSSGKWQAISLVNRFNPRPASAFSASYRFVRDSSNTVDFAAQWPIAPYWYAVGRYQYAFRNIGGVKENQNSGVVEALAGVEYDGGCWVGRVVMQQYAASASQRNAAIFFQIELNGMGRVGPSPLAVLTRSIPNYQMINQIAPLPAKFDNFQ
jgi:LPS-assembly protein